MRPPMTLSPGLSTHVNELQELLLARFRSADHRLLWVENIGILFDTSKLILGQYRVGSMWRQKAWFTLYSHATGCIKEAPLDSEASIGALYLVCLLIRHANISAANTSQLMSVAVRVLIRTTRKSTSSDDTETELMQRCALDSISQLLETDLSTISSYVSTVIPVILTVCCEGTAASSRIAGLSIIQEMSGLQYSILFPVQKTVVRSLSKVIDDPKRRVRQLASKVRNTWLTLK